MCNGPFISPDSNHSSRNSTFSKQHFSPRDDQHGGKPSCPLADRQGGATLARFGGLLFRPNGWTQLDQIWHAGGREGGEGGEGRGGEGRGGEGAGQGRAGQGRAGQGRAGQGRAGAGRGGEGGEGRGGEGRGGEGRGLSTLSTNQNLCDRGA